MKKKFSKILITGGAGFIGSHLSNKLLDLGYLVVVVDTNLRSNFKKNNLVCYRRDVSDPLIKKIFQKETPQLIFHLAGPISLRQPIDSPKFLKGLNFLEVTLNLLNVVSEYKVKKVIFVSSGGAIYENASEIPTSENYQVHPRTLYGLANLMIEEFLEKFCSQNEIKWQILRLSNVYGPGQWKEGIIPNFIISLLGNKAPIIHGSGKQTRDFVFVNDIINAFILAINKDKNGIFNVASGQEVSINTVFNHLVKLMKKVDIKPDYQLNSQAGTQRSCLNSSKFQNAFGWKAKTSLKEGLSKTILWYKKNP